MVASIKFKLHFVLLLFMSISFECAFSQDLIIKKNGDEIKCKVEEITSDQIKYSFRQAPDTMPRELISINKIDVFMIRYENGTKDVFYEATSPSNDEYVKIAASPSSSEIQSSDKIEIEHARYYYHNRQIGKNRLISMLRKEKDPEINSLVTKAVLCSVFSPILKFATIPAGVFGFMVLSIASVDNSSLSTQDQTLAGVGIGTLVLGQAGGYTLDYFKKQHFKKAVELYNQKHL